MQAHQKVLFVDASTGFYRMQRYNLGDFFGPVDLGLHLAGKYNSLNIGTGLLAGSIFPGSNRLIFTGFSLCWGGFYISSMGGAGLVFDNLGINMVSILGKAPSPSILYLNRVHGEEVQVEMVPVNVDQVWKQGRGGMYGLTDHVFDRFADRYSNDPRILAVGPAAQATDFGALCSAPISKGELSNVDTWAGRGGFGSKLLQIHGIAAIIYGGTYVDEDFRDRNVADQWFEQRYNKKMAAKDMEATAKYRFEPNFETGGTFGVNFATLGGQIIAFNYRSMYMPEDERLAIHDKLIVKHYLRQFNEETIKPKKQRTCGEPCVAVCKKMHNEFKKDYEPYQTMGPLTGIFDQRAAERLNHHADMYGFDAISVGGVLAWLMECLSENLLSPEELGVTATPVFAPDGFAVETDSIHNAELGVALLDAIIEQRGLLNLEQGARKFARQLAREKGKAVLDPFVYVSYARKGWMVPNQYWTPGALSPMAIMGKYYMYYGSDFYPPRELGRQNAERLRQELLLDNIGICRFHRKWAEEMIPEIVESLYGMKEQYLENNAITASRINSRNSSIFWESERNIDFIYTFLKRKQVVENNTDAELLQWIAYFEKDRQEAALSFWYEVHKGIQESLREF
ncbi:aldehyde ferredoxin oxidoreductase [Candidatus Vecturithrix granuli]|uniref:Aldehyde ferredoxin oxidoreductase n=1 Tax=Vecturithrix granuli TaxID=1499967 RepID=A0A081C9C3_VECG1|nr:aldehyde ferredoxin oxidoreductase [Candidatus Vecturithrix granuli]